MFSILTQNGDQAPLNLQNPIMATPSLNPFPYPHTITTWEPTGEHSPQITRKHSNDKRGLIWCYAFLREEALKCFKQAVAHDEKCLVGYWGMAHAKGNNYNMISAASPDFAQIPMRRTRSRIVSDRLHSHGTSSIPQTWRTRLARSMKPLMLAREKGATGSKLEEALFNSLLSRYPKENREKKDVDAWNLAHATEIKKIYQEYGDDFEVALLFAESLMVKAPWNLWNSKTGEPTEGVRSLEANEVIERALVTGKAWNYPVWQV